MSTNTTSTNEQVAADTLTVEGTPGPAQDAQKYQNLSAAFASLPDPAEIARLANEFFAALPALFAVHQFIEGFVWLGLDGTLSATVAHNMGAAYML